MEDCFSRPVTGVAGRTVTCIDRTSYDYNHTFYYTGTTTQALNVSSYNYLGFAQSRGGCADAVEEAIRNYGVCAGGNRADVGTLDLHTEAEKLVARFLGTEDAMIISMGFATNSTALPALVGKGCLIISDELNHSSIRFGSRLSGAMVRMYKHNDMVDLEKLLREVISQGQPRTHRPWKKILLVVEGLYSMEGTLVNLPAIMALKPKYKVLLPNIGFVRVEIDWLTTLDTRSFISTSTKRIQSALSAPTAGVYAITSKSILLQWTSSWVPLQSRCFLRMT
jgi:serine palmitoyltransferase